MASHGYGIFFFFLSPFQKIQVELQTLDLKDHQVGRPLYGL